MKVAKNKRVSKLREYAIEKKSSGGTKLRFCWDVLPCWMSNCKGSLFYKKTAEEYAKVEKGAYIVLTKGG